MEDLLAQELVNVALFLPFSIRLIGLASKLHTDGFGAVARIEVMECIMIVPELRKVLKLPLISNFFNLQWVKFTTLFHKTNEKGRDLGVALQY